MARCRKRVRSQRVNDVSRVNYGTPANDDAFSSCRSVPSGVVLPRAFSGRYGRQAQLPSFPRPVRAFRYASHARRHA